jgi:flagellar biosynthesis/type III secretory pathway protein FliH
MRQYEEAKRMQYVTSVEQIGIRKGIEQGLQQGIEQGMQRGEVLATRQAVKEILMARFGVVPPSITEAVNRIGDSVILRALLRRAATVERLEDFDGHLLENSTSGC